MHDKSRLAPLLQPFRPGAAHAGAEILQTFERSFGTRRKDTRGHRGTHPFQGLQRFGRGMIEVQCTGRQRVNRRQADACDQHQGKWQTPQDRGDERGCKAEEGVVHGRQCQKRRHTRREAPACLSARWTGRQARWIKRPVVALPRARYRVPDAKYQVPGNRYQVSGGRCHRCQDTLSSLERAW